MRCVADVYSTAYDRRSFFATMMKLYQSAPRDKLSAPVAGPICYFCDCSQLPSSRTSGSPLQYCSIEIKKQREEEEKGPARRSGGPPTLTLNRAALDPGPSSRAGL